MAEKPKGPVLPPPEPHTLMKHVILRQYLNAWFPILTNPNGFPRAIFIDGFAGSGVYADGSKGSPLIAIDAATNQPRPITSQLDFIFIEQNKERYQTLEGEIAKLQVTKPRNFNYKPLHADFTEVMPNIIASYDAKPSKFRAAFVFLDPFGYKGIPLQLIKEIMRHPNCEVFINFMYDEINRFLGVEESDSCRNDLFGTEGWRKVVNEGDSRKRKQLLHDLYQGQLKEVAGIKYVRSFQMINEQNSTDFYLFFGTNNPEGLRVMKNAMWKVDVTGHYRFSDRTNPQQAVMFANPDYEDLKSLLRKKFGGQEVTFSEVARFVLEETPFRDDAHLKLPTLKPMEKDGEIQVFEPDGSTRKGQGYSNPDLKIRFLNNRLF